MMDRTKNSVKADWTNIDRLLEDYFKWVENWDELRDWERSYLKALAWQKEFKDIMSE